MEINLSIKITDTITDKEIAQIHELIETVFKTVSFDGIQLSLDDLAEETNNEF